LYVLAIHDQLKKFETEANGRHVIVSIGQSSLIAMIVISLVCNGLVLCLGRRGLKLLKPTIKNIDEFKNSNYNPATLAKKSDQILAFSCRMKRTACFYIALVVLNLVILYNSYSVRPVKGDETTNQVVEGKQHHEE